MVEPSWPRGSWRRRVRGGLGLALGLGIAGCSVVPKSRLDDCHRLGQTLQAENARLKDVTLSLRSQNQDLAQRAVDDARRLKVQGEAIHRLEKSVTAYQSERDQLAREFERIKSDLHASANPLPTALIGDLRAFAEAHTGCAFDPEFGTLTIPSASLFVPDTDRLTAEGHALLRDAAGRLNAPEAKGLGLRIVGHTEGSAVRPAGLEEPPARPPHLGLDRAARVRDLLSSEGGVDPDSIEVAGHDAAPSSTGAEADPGDDQGRRIEIHLRRREGRDEPAPRG